MLTNTSIFRHVFTELARQRHYLNDKEYFALTSVFDLVTEKTNPRPLPSLDVLIYLNTDVTTVKIVLV